MSNPRHLSLSQEHYSPPSVIEPARAALGRIDLDPFSCAAANRVVRAETYFCLEPRADPPLRGHVVEPEDPERVRCQTTGCTDGADVPRPCPAVWCEHVHWNTGNTTGLSFFYYCEVHRPSAPAPPQPTYGTQVVADGFARPWRGRVFCNPPGGWTEDRDSSQKRAWFKLASEYMAGRVRAAVFLSFSVELLQTTQVDTPRGPDGAVLPVPLDFPICYPSRRVAYLRETTRFVGSTNDGGPHPQQVLEVGTQPPHASCVVWLSPRRRCAGCPNCTATSCSGCRNGWPLSEADHHYHDGLCDGKMVPAPNGGDERGEYVSRPGVVLEIRRFVEAFRTLGRVVVPSQYGREEDWS